MSHLKTPNSPVVCNEFLCQNYLEEPCICFSKYKFQLFKKAIRNLDSRTTINNILAKRRMILEMNDRIDS